MFGRLYNSFVMSLGMFTRIPAPRADFSKGTKGMMAAFPFVGLLLGLLWWGIARLATTFMLPPVLTGAFLALYPFLITGFLHLDGFMDVSDAILSRRPLEERLRILKDPHTGAFAVCSLGMLLVAFTAACIELAPRPYIDALIWIPVLSRVLSAVGVLTQKPLPTSSLGKTFQAGANHSELVLVILTGCVTAAWMIWRYQSRGLLTVSAMGTVQLVATLRCRRQLGGFSGDVAGYMLCLGELAAVISLVLWR